MKRQSCLGYRDEHSGQEGEVIILVGDDARCWTLWCDKLQLGPYNSTFGAQADVLCRIAKSGYNLSFGQTPGEWWYRNGRIVSRSGCVLATLPISINKDEDVMNGKLMALAPELLNQNIRLIRCMVEMMSGSSGNGHRSHADMEASWKTTLCETVEMIGRLVSQ